MFPNPRQTILHFEHVTLLTLRVGLELFCSFFLMNLKDALHNFNIGSITSPVATSQNNRAGAYHFDSHHLENNDKKCLNVRRSSVR